jgi:hypothetical protein
MRAAKMNILPMFCFLVVVIVANVLIGSSGKVLGMSNERIAKIVNEHFPNRSFQQNVSFQHGTKATESKGGAVDFYAETSLSGGSSEAVFVDIIGKNEASQASDCESFIRGIARRISGKMSHLPKGKGVNTHALICYNKKLLPLTADDMDLIKIGVQGETGLGSQNVIVCPLPKIEK